MKFDWVAPAIAGVALLLTVLAQWRHRSHCAREAAAMREAIDRHQGACCERLDGLRRSHEDLETSLRNTRDTLRNGRLNDRPRGGALSCFVRGCRPMRLRRSRESRNVRCGCWRRSQGCYPQIDQRGPTGRTAKRRSR